jgi:hypothetical protein
MGQEFLKRPTSLRAFESFVMSDKWEMYFSQFDEDPAAVLVDLGIAETVPDPDRPKLLWMSLQMKSPDENGFASEEEEDLLTKTEDTFIDAECNPRGSHHHRRTTGVLLLLQDGRWLR